MRFWAPPLLVALALFAGGCGGGGDDGAGNAGAESASIAPGDVPFFAAVDTDFEGEQWERAEALIRRFPSGDELIQMARDGLEEEGVDWERDVKPAFGPEVGIVLFDVEGDDPPGAFFTDSPDPAKLQALLAKQEDEDFVTEEVEGWQVVAEDQADLERFKSARADGAIEGEEGFDEALDAVGEAGAAVYIRGSEVQREIDESIAEEGGPPNASSRFGRLEWLAFSSSAEEDGVEINGIFSGEGLEVESYEPTLDAAVPAGALAFFSFGNLEGGFRRGLEAVGDAVPDFDRQRAQLEQALGFDLEQDLFPLFRNEGAIAVYTGSPIPGVTIMLKIDDEQKANRVLERFGAIAQLGGQATTRTFSIDGTTAREIAFTEQGFSVFGAVFDGKVAVATSEAGLRAARGTGEKLADDVAYEEAREAAGLSGDTAGFLYMNLEDAVSLGLDFIEDRGETIDPEVRANLEPLKAFLLHSSREGDSLRISGFLEIE